MDFAFDETQQEIARLCGDVLAREPDTAWKALGEAGLLALAVPERLGGDGLGVLEIAVLLTEVGRCAVDVPALATLALGVLPIVRFGTEEQQDTLLPLVSDTHGVLTAALSEPSAPLPTLPHTTARRDGDGFVVSGTKVAVPHASAADKILVSALLDEGPGVLVIDPAHAEVNEGTVRLDEVRAEMLLGDDTSGRVVEGLRQYALAGACALADGVLAGALDLTVGYVGTRHQFGKPLSAFQAVACQVADVYIASRTLHLIATSACWRLATGRDASEDLDTAGYWLAAEALPAVHTCHHLHGGMGLDVTYPMHRFYGLAKELTRFVGGADHRLDQLAEGESRVR